jgi:hypothetical protein
MLQVCVFLNLISASGERAVTKEEGQHLADQYGCKFLESSAKTNVNIREIFATLVNLVDNSEFKHQEKKRRFCPFL